MTNEEYLKNMTTKELAKYLFAVTNHPEYCYGICGSQGKVCENNADCIEEICKFLKQEKE